MLIVIDSVSEIAIDDPMRRLVLESANCVLSLIVILGRVAMVDR